MSSPHTVDNDYYYTVLGVPRSASAEELRERYRALALVFHPDKHASDGDERLRDVAAKRHLEVQKAYEALSDPFNRTVYDTLGEEGLKTAWPSHLRNLPPEQLRDVLLGLQLEATRLRVENMVRPRGSLTLGFDASALATLGKDEVTSEWSLSRRVAAIPSMVRASRFGLRHSVQKDVGENTTLTFSTRMNRSVGFVHGAPRMVTNALMVGSVRHQFSPRLSVQVSTPLLASPFLTISSTYATGGSAFSLETYASPAFVMHRIVPPTKLSFARQLYPDSAEQGVVTAFLAGEGSWLSLNLVHPRPFSVLPAPSAFGAPMNDIDGDDAEAANTAPPSALTALGSGGLTTQYALLLAGASSKIGAEVALAFEPLALELSAGAHMILQGLIEWSLGATWYWRAEDSAGANRVYAQGTTDTSVSATVALNLQGVVLRLQATWLGQKLTVPITLASADDDSVAVLAALVPATLTALYYALVARRRQRRKRAQFWSDAHARMRDAGLDARREADDTVSLLRDVAARHTRAETARDGLVVLDARYAPRESAPEVAGLAYDVTVPLQARVHRSQLAVPGGRTKARIPGFFDPAPGAEKVLAVRYEFRGREHFVEVADDAPLVLPQADHLVQGA